MTAVFYIAHSTSGRTRIRWVGDTSEKDRIGALSTDIEKLHGVDSAVPKMASGSIIIEHNDMDWSTLQPLLTDQLSLEFTPTTRSDSVESVGHSLENIDGALKHVNMDLTSLTLLLLGILAVVQALRGQVMSTSSSYLWYAFNVFAFASRNKAEQRIDDTPDST